MISKGRQRTPKSERLRDDKFLARRVAFKAQLQRDVREKIRFFPPFITQHVFFQLSPNNGRTLIFKGHREMGVVNNTRIVSHIVEQLKKAEMRPFLIQKMTELKLELPTDEEWRKYTDAATGDINIGILYSDWVNNLFRSYARLARLHGNKPTVMRSMTTARDYLAIYHKDLKLVPSLETWAQSMGPLTEADFVSRSQTGTVAQVEGRVRAKEVRAWGKAQVLETLATLSLDAQMAILDEATRRRLAIVQELEERHYFITKFKEVLYSLDEMKAITNPLELYRGGFARQFVLEHRGAYFPTYVHTGLRVSQLSKEERARLCPFGYIYEGQPSTGQKLYIRFCGRDYGLELAEAVRRYSRLSDLQRAAICFPFHVPIAPSAASRVAFRNFYNDMCRRYGLVAAHGTKRGSHIFERAMRQRWVALGSREREGYGESDRVAEVFPLVKPASSEGGDGADGTHSATMAEYFTDEPPTDSLRVKASEGTSPSADGAEETAEAEEDEEEEENESAAVRAASQISPSSSSSSRAVPPSPRRSTAQRVVHHVEERGDDAGIQVIMM